MPQKIGTEAVLETDNFARGLKLYIDGLRKMSEETKSSTKQANVSFGDLNRSLNKLGLGFSAVQIVREVRRAVSESLQEFGQFETGIREVFTLIPGISGVAMSEMEDQIIAAGIEMGRLSDETVPALYQALSAGIPAENVFDFLTTANVAARGGVTDLETAVDGLSSVVNAYGVNVLSAGEASDIMFTAIRLGKTTFPELADNLANVTPLAAALGVDFEDIAAALSTITAQGTRTVLATTQLKALLNELSKEGLRAADSFKEIAGVSFPEFIRQGNSLNDALQVLEEAANDSGIEINEMFGNIRAGLGALQLTGEQADRFARDLGEMDKAAGASDLALSQFTDTLELAEQKTAAASEALQIHLGEALAPARLAWLEFKTSVIEGADALITASKEIEEFFDKTEPETIEAMSNELAGLIDNLAGMSVGASILGAFAGQTQASHDRMRELTVEIAKQSGSFDELIERLEKAGLENVRLEERQGELVLISDTFGRTVLGNAAALKSYSNTAAAASFDSAKLAQVQKEVTDTTEEETQAQADLDAMLAEVEEQLRLATQAQADFAASMVTGGAATFDFNEFLLEFASSAGATSDEILELARSTKDYSSEQLEAADIIAEAREESERLREEVEAGTITAREAALQLEELFGARIADAQAILEESQAQEDLTDNVEKGTETLSAYQQALLETQTAMSGFFVSALATKDEIGFFTTAIENLGDQFVTIGGRTADQAEDLDRLQSEYDRVTRSIRDYQIGLEGATLTEEERAEKLGELTERQVQLASSMEPLLAITGELQAVTVDAVVNNDALKQALFDAAAAAEADALTLALLGGELGLFTDAEIKAALKTAVLQEKIALLGSEIADGSISVGDAITELNDFAIALDKDYTLALETGNLNAVGLDLENAGKQLDRIDESGAIDIIIQAETEDAILQLDEAEQRLADIVGTAEENATTVQETTAAAYEEAALAAKLFADDTSVAVAEGMEETSGSIIDNTEEMVSAFTSGVEEMQDVVAGGMDEITTTVDEGVVEMVDIFTSKLDTLSIIFSEEVTQIVGVADAAVPIMVTIGEDFVFGLASGASNASGVLNDTIVQIVNDAVEAAKAAAEISSPSEVMREVGVDFLAGFALGLEDEAPDVNGILEAIVQNFIQTGMLAGDAVDFLTEALREAGEEGDALNMILDRTLDIASDFASAGSQFASMFEDQVLGGLEDGIQTIDDQTSDLLERLNLSTLPSDFELAALRAEALLRGDQARVNVIDEIVSMQKERNALEDEFAAQQQIILDLQREQQELDFLQTQLDLLRTIQEAGLDPSEILEGIELGLDASLPDLIQAMTGVISAMVDQVNEELEITSPSRVFARIGEQIVSGMRQGITDAASVEQTSDIIFSGLPQFAFDIPAPIFDSRLPVGQAVQAGAQREGSVVNFGDTIINNDMDTALFETKVRRIVAEAIT